MSKFEASAEIELRDYGRGVKVGKVGAGEMTSTGKIPTEAPAQGLGGEHR